MKTEREYETRECKGPDAEGSTRVLHPFHHRPGGSLRVRYHREAEGCRAGRRRGDRLPAADAAEKQWTSQLPLEGIHLGTTPEILPADRAGYQVPQGTGRDLGSPECRGQGRDAIIKR